MALLQMINSVRGKIREERIGLISVNDLLTTEIIDLLNDAASEILESHDWSFDTRFDGILFYPGINSVVQSINDGLADSIALMYDATSDPTAFNISDTGDGQMFEDMDEFGFRYSGDRRSWIVPNGTAGTNLDTNDAYAVTNIDKIGNGIQFSLGNPLFSEGSFISLFTDWSIFANEHVLPATVRQVLSAHSDEHDLSLEFVDRAGDFNQRVPRKQLYTSDITEVMIVGGSLVTTSRTESTGTWATGLGAVAATTGIGAMIWPIPENDLRIHYSYRYQHPDMATETDSLAGVPKNVVHLIEWRAVQMAFESGIKNDVLRARHAERQVEKRLIRALEADDPQPNRRRVPIDFRASGRYINPRRRWASQTTPTP